jgi:hypothetical protein
MRRVRIALIVAVVLGGTAPMSRAQMAHSALESECGCQSCVPMGINDPMLHPLAHDARTWSSAVCGLRVAGRRVL